MVTKSHRATTLAATLGAALLAATAHAQAISPIDTTGATGDGSDGTITRDGGDVIVTDGEMPPWVNVASVQFAGTGCPAGDAIGTFYDPSLLEIDTGGLFVHTGDGGSLRAARAFCQGVMTLDYPAGWTYRIAAAELDVDTTLGAATTASVSLSSYFQGDAATGGLAQSYAGGADASDTLRGELAGGAFAPCDAPRALNVKLEASVHGADRGWLEVSGPAYLVLEWKRCP